MVWVRGESVLRVDFTSFLLPRVPAADDMMPFIGNIRKLDVAKHNGTATQE
jgi:hypothetical protein